MVKILLMTFAISIALVSSSVLNQNSDNSDEIMDQFSDEKNQDVEKGWWNRPSPRPCERRGDCFDVESRENENMDMNVNEQHIRVKREKPVHNRSDPKPQCTSK